jgi:hypothetical protein
MNTLQMIQQLTPAIAAIAVLALPWATLLAMPAVEAASNSKQDDQWHTRVGAALRWSSVMGRSRTVQPAYALAA